jgi:hypothetical protein
MLTRRDPRRSRFRVPGSRFVFRFGSVFGVHISGVRELSVSAPANPTARARKAPVEAPTKASQLARMLGACGGTLPAFELPLSRTDLGLLTVARQFAQDTVGIEADSLPGQVRVPRGPPA